ELRRVRQLRPLEDTDGRAADQARAQQLKMKTADLRKVIRALNVLSEEPLVSGADLAEQAIRQDSQSQLAYLANANYYRLRGSWLEFDRMMRYAEDTETGNVIGTSSVISRLSWPGRPHTYFQIRKREFYSTDLQTGQVHLTLQLGTDETGPSEVVQVAAYTDRKGAEVLVGRLRKRGFDSYISDTQPKGSHRYRVRVRPPSGDSANQLAARLEAQGHGVWITKE
ncbi:MAG: SPOR domain-containing protein, partial [Myxococcales bacterium]|nr:SPOR domain-containing protein [Myxococcales bacterium]